MGEHQEARKSDQVTLTENVLGGLNTKAHMAVARRSRVTRL